MKSSRSAVASPIQRLIAYEPGYKRIYGMCTAKLCNPISPSQGCTSSQKSCTGAPWLVVIITPIEVDPTGLHTSTVRLIVNGAPNATVAVVRDIWRNSIERNLARPFPDRSEERRVGKECRSR